MLIKHLSRVHIPRIMYIDIYSLDKDDVSPHLNFTLSAVIQKYIINYST